MENPTRPDWMNDESVKDIDPKKLDFISRLFTESRGKSQKEMFAFLMPMMKKAKQEHLTFTQKEMQNAITAIKKYSTEEEVRKIENMLSKSTGMKLPPF